MKGTMKTVGEEIANQQHENNDRRLNEVIKEKEKKMGLKKETNTLRSNKYGTR